MSHFVTTQKREDISEWFRTICKVTVGDAIPDVPGVLSMDRKTPVSEVLSTLEELEIQSVAISAPPNSYIGAGGVNVVSQGQQIIGIVSIIDVLAFSLKNNDYLTRAVSEVIGSTNESLTLWCEESKKPLYFAMEQFIKGVHHSLVQNTEDPNVPLKYLAQTDIVRFLIHNPDAFPALEAILVQPVEVVTTCFVTPAYLSTPLVEAIALLVEHGAVPVVNEDGIVVSNLSASDFKGKSTTDLRAAPGKSHSKFVFLSAYLNCAHYYRYVL